MARPLTLALVILLVVGAVTAQGAMQSGRGPGIATQQEFERTVFEVTVFQNGSARWTFEFSRPLTNESQRQQFQEYADRFNSEDTDLWQNFQERARLLTQAGTETTERNMTARGFSRTARVNPLGNRGIVRMSFIWTGFGTVDGQRVSVGDVFEDGLYIGPNQQFEVEAGPGLAFSPDAVQPRPDNMTAESIGRSSSLSWTGERQFNDQRPNIVLVPPESVTTAGPTPVGNGSNGTPATGDTDTGSPPWMVVGLILVLLGLGAGAAWKSGTLTDSDDESGGAAAASTVTSDARSNAAAAGTATADSATDSTAEPAVSDEELLTDEDRVIQLLEENGGRMKQANIVDETGWSKSKVSMLLSDMEDEEAISKLRVGRENIVSLSGHEPDAAGSPFEDK